MKLDLFHIIKTYEKELQHEMYEAYVTSEKFSISVPSICVVYWTEYCMWYLEGEIKPIQHCHLYCTIRNNV